MTRYREPEECDRCGEMIRTSAHRLVCDEASAAAFGRTEGCPMCGEAYDDYFAHLQRCDANGGDSGERDGSYSADV